MYYAFFYAAMDFPLVDKNNISIIRKRKKFS